MLPKGKPHSKTPDLSVVIPVYNEVEQNLLLLIERVGQVVLECKLDFELVFVNDGSGPDTTCVLFELASTRPGIKLVNLSRNYGESAAISAGYDNAAGDVVINMDSDLQDPPEMIPTMLDYHRQGYDIVFTRQASRQESPIRKLCAALFYRLLSASTSVNVPVDAGEFRLMSRRAIEALRALPEKRRFLRGLVPALGFRQIVIPYHRPGRACGQSEYTLKKLIHLAVEGFLTMSFSPILLLCGLSIMLFCLGCLVLAFGFHSFFNAIIGSLLVCCAVNVFAVTVVGAYVAMTLAEARGRPAYIVADIIEAAEHQQSALPVIA